MPQDVRSDTVLATVGPVHALEAASRQRITVGDDLTFTVGKPFADASVHSITKVPGETGFCLEFRSQQHDLLAQMVDSAQHEAAGIAASRRVRFDLGLFSEQAPATMDAGLRTAPAEGSGELEIATRALPSAAGHDVQDFVHAGLPASAAFVVFLLGIHAARHHDMPRTQNSGQPPALATPYSRFERLTT